MERKVAKLQIPTKPRSQQRGSSRCPHKTPYPSPTHLKFLHTTTYFLFTIHVVRDLFFFFFYFLSENEALQLYYIWQTEFFPSLQGTDA